eukprot:g22081.t1
MRSRPPCAALICAPLGKALIRLLHAEVRHSRKLTRLKPSSSFYSVDSSYEIRPSLKEPLVPVTIEEPQYNASERPPSTGLVDGKAAADVENPAHGGEDEAAEEVAEAEENPQEAAQRSDSEAVKAAFTPSHLQVGKEKEGSAEYQRHLEERISVEPPSPDLESQGTPKIWLPPRTGCPLPLDPGLAAGRAFWGCAALRGHKIAAQDQRQEIRTRTMRRAPMCGLRPVSAMTYSLPAVTYDFQILPGEFANLFTVEVPEGAGKPDKQAKGQLQNGKPAVKVAFRYNPPAENLPVIGGVSLDLLNGIGQWISVKAKGILAGGFVPPGEAPNQEHSVRGAAGGGGETRRRRVAGFRRSPAKMLANQNMLIVTMQACHRHTGSVLALLGKACSRLSLTDLANECEEGLLHGRPVTGSCRCQEICLRGCGGGIQRIAVEPQAELRGRGTPAERTLQKLLRSTA